MNTRPLLTTVVALGMSLPTWPRAAPATCPIPGEVIQWIADYCMLEAQTDDEIAVSGCIEVHVKEVFSSACAAKLHFKRSMCRTLGKTGELGYDVEACVADPDFMGRTVRHGGVG